MRYVDGYVLPIPKKKLKDYKKIATFAGKIWKEHGALDYKECVGDDIAVARTYGMVPFNKTAKAKSDEVVIFAFIVFKSKKHRTAVNAKVMKDPRIHAMCNEKNVPFNPRRMAYGGFQAFVDPK